jgi:hypothetical protein
VGRGTAGREAMEAFGSGPQQCLISTTDSFRRSFIQGIHQHYVLESGSPFFAMTDILWISLMVNTTLWYVHHTRVFIFFLDVLESWAVRLRPCREWPSVVL